ncbi:MAG: [FeFe] hydrogenase H-cluster maturation GTPase HydF [Sedimentisphaerales bacterium]|nr:[FeFe] hydrogenase H-cluster maturation GTPase HydF [Sedimentisphaerales bacterium]MBN2843663.1 [FeFe] hydrogenase H-cluster maturation GTPase HydF [Sedimentisphaerales bacterium]
MTIQSTPKGMRLHIGLFGRRNVGKSSLLNAIVRQSVSIVSDVAGTTTDPIEKPMELLPIGPVVFIDTAGVDDVGALGELRVEKTRGIFRRTELAIVVTDGIWDKYEQGLTDELRAFNIPVIAVLNKTDLQSPAQEAIDKLNVQKIDYVTTSALGNEGIDQLRQLLVKKTPDDFLNTPTILADLVPPGELAVLVVPIDKEAPKGRLILPQVNCIRDLLDNDSYCMVVKERELRDCLDRLKTPPALVVTDSQAFLKVDADTPPEILMTSFSILFARYKGDLDQFVIGATKIDSLKPGDKVLIAEACSHHPSCEDIGRVKIPRWLRQYVGGDLQADVIQGHNFPSDLGQYKLMIHCGGCMFNRREVLSRTMLCQQVGVPVTNYGLAIAYCLGIFQRALKPFPAAWEYYQMSLKS